MAAWSARCMRSHSPDTLTRAAVVKPVAFRAWWHSVQDTGVVFKDGADGASLASFCCAVVGIAPLLRAEQQVH
eukprot:803609-Amphidinium_carterae.1